MSNDTTNRDEFLEEILDAAGQGHAEFMELEGWSEAHGPGPNYTIIDDGIEDGNDKFLVTLATVRRGFGIIAKAKHTEANETDVKYLPDSQRKRINEINKSNGDDGDYDAIDAMAIVEIGLWGAVTYG